MNSIRKTAVIVGVLFIIAFVFDLLAMAISEPILNAPDYLVGVSAKETQWIIGVLIDAINVKGFSSSAIDSLSKTGLSETE